ncbi:BRCT domain [Plasmopara halstedii]|uniref:BRCT domain n=1 Tax=Plasmopara halstedii TaxID=4781 RepID=A0A0N7L3M4_PLAHL|nr:BRCT domain [Plasmopara halstedii]CEG36283.1 BRCT domain [Plasmopara halstedii]|eukprot:XP_024572652.1 BRCT domain [Plasmopara halstedii]
MFAVNGPSGPTSRNERRVRSNQQREEEEKIKRRWIVEKRKHFFLEKRERVDVSQQGNKKMKTVAALSDIFKGCRIVFNGRTGNVTSYYLAKLVQEHGGSVGSTLTTSRVTHMIGSNLNGSKADKALMGNAKVKFVRPGTSIKRNKRLSEFEFLVYKDQARLLLPFSKADSIGPSCKNDLTNKRDGKSNVV